MILTVDFHQWISLVIFSVFSIFYWTMSSDRLTLMAYCLRSSMNNEDHQWWSSLVIFIGYWLFSQILRNVPDWHSCPNAWDATASKNTNKQMNASWTSIFKWSSMISSCAHRNRLYCLNWNLWRNMDIIITFSMQIWAMESLMFR